MMRRALLVAVVSVLLLAVATTAELSFYLVSDNPNGLSYAQGTGELAYLSDLVFAVEDPSGNPVESSVSAPPVVEVLVFPLKKGCKPHSSVLPGCDWTDDLGLGIRKEDGSQIWCCSEQDSCPKGSTIVNKEVFPGKVFPMTVNKDGRLDYKLFTLDPSSDSILAFSYCQTDDGPEVLHVAGNISWEGSVEAKPNLTGVTLFFLVAALYWCLMTGYAYHIKRLTGLQMCILATLGQSFVVSLGHVLIFYSGRNGHNRSTLEHAFEVLRIFQFTTARCLMVLVSVGISIEENRKHPSSTEIVQLSSLSMLDVGTQLWRYTKPDTLGALWARTTTGVFFSAWALVSLGRNRQRLQINNGKAKYWALFGIVLLSYLPTFVFDGIPILKANKFLLPVVGVAVLWLPKTHEIKYQGMASHERDADARLELPSVLEIEESSSNDSEENWQWPPASE